jgi:glyoxylase-like metal-dependent hydrolase (beta-lactamase superfamily II)
MGNEIIETRRTQHGPFERIMFIAPDLFRPAAQSVYRVGDTLIDTAGTRVADALVAALQSDPPRRVLLTHQHEDHVGGVGALRRAFGHIPVHVARSYLPLLSTIDRVPDYRARYWGNPELICDAIGFEPGDVFELDGFRLETLETPGHTPFHISFVARLPGVTYALTGDLFTSASPLVAWFESASDDTSRSCRAVANAGPDVYLLPTHGKARANGRETLSALADLMDQKAGEVAAAAERLGTRNYQRIALAVFGDGDAFLAEHSGNEYSYANFVRSVLDPVRSLPASVLDTPTCY